MRTTERYKLYAAELKNMAKGRHQDGLNGLYLNVTEKGTRSWMQRMTIDGKRRDLGLGGFPKVSLAAARAKARENKMTARNGTGIAAPRRSPRPAPAPRSRASTAPTFAEALEKFWELHAPTLKEGNAKRTWTNSLKTYALPAFGDAPVDTITRTQVLDVLTPIWTRKPSVGKHLRQRMGRVFGWAMAHGYIDLNPAREVIDGALPQQTRAAGHHAAIPYQEIQEVLKKFDDATEHEITRLAFRFLVLTAARSAEARQVHLGRDRS